MEQVKNLMSKFNHGNNVFGIDTKDYDFEAHKELVPMQPGDVPVTYADTTPLEEDFGFKPSTSLRKGLRKFAEWYVCTL